MSAPAWTGRAAALPSPTGAVEDVALRRTAAVLLVVGGVAQVPLALLHPHGEDPNDSPHVFEEYAASADWQAVHLGQFLGALLLAFGLVAAARALGRAGGLAGVAAVLAGVAATVAAAVFAVQMAVDGIALKAAIDAWRAASGDDVAGAFGVAEAVRSTEKGLSALFNLTNGVTVLLLGASVLLGRRLPAWIGVLGAVAGAAFLVLGFVTAWTGFSPEASRVALVGTVAAPLTLLALAVALWRDRR